MNAQNRRLLDEINNEPTSRFLMVWIIAGGILVLIFGYGLLLS